MNDKTLPTWVEGTYDPNNIFAKILRCEAPCHEVYEDPDILAFLDAFPQNRGHTLLIPRRATSRNLFDIDPSTLARLTVATQLVARAIVSALQPDGVQIFQQNAADAGQTAFHMHVHVVPRWRGGSLGLRHAQKGDPAELAELALLISRHLP